TDSSSAYFASEFERLYGTGLDEEWGKWIEFEHAWQRDNLDSIRRYPVTPERPVLSSSLGSVSRAWPDSASGQVILAVNFPGRIAHVTSLNPRTGTMNDVCDIPTPALYYVASIAYDESSKTVFYTTHNGSMWRDLYRTDVRTGETKLLVKYGRI